MLLVALLIGVVLIVSAIRNSQAALFADLSTDAPGFVVWAAAIFAVGAVGYIPGLKPISRGLLALVLLVIVLKNYQTIIAGFQSAAAAASKSSASNAAPATTPAATGSGSSGSGVTLSSLTDFANAFGSNAGAA